MTDPVKTITANLDRPLVMLGLMGAGKTKIGGLLAKALGIPFVDADHEIEQAAGMPVSDIFEHHGEAAFRDLERKVLARLLCDEVKVIAPGGGAIMNEQTAKIVFDKALTIWLKADLDVLVERTGWTDKRPLLRGGDRAEILGNLLNARNPIYEQSKLHFQTDTSSAEDATERLVVALADHLKEKT